MKLNLNKIRRRIEQQLKKLPYATLAQGTVYGLGQGLIAPFLIGLLPLSEAKPPNTDTIERAPKIQTAPEININVPPEIEAAPEALIAPEIGEPR